MCHFITAVLPASAQVPELTEIARRHGRELDVLHSASVLKQLRPEERYFLTTAGRCDCGTALGAVARQEQLHKSSQIHTEVRKLKSKGWNEAKISRWRQQRQDHETAIAAKIAVKSTESISAWGALIRESVVSGFTPYLGLLIHSYDGSIDKEQVALKGRERVSIGNQTSSVLGSLTEDTLYEFVA